MLRPTSPSPRRSQDARPNTPPPVTPLRRSSSDVSYRPSRFLAKLKNTSNSNPSNTGVAGTLKIPSSHSRTGSNPALAPASPSPISSTTTSKPSLSPKSAREMHRDRLGTIPAQVATLAPAMSNLASASSLSLASTLTSNTAPSTDPWHMLNFHVLPMFNSETLRMPIEELNQLVKKHISSAVSRSPSRAISALEQDITALLARGMITLNVRLSQLDDIKLLSRLVEVWEIFWHWILPYVEGIFHPLRTEKPILSLSRTPKTNRPSSPTLQEETHLSTSTQFIDVRVLALRSFRDSIILPISTQLQTLLSPPRKDAVNGCVQSYHPILQQMLLVLASTANHSNPLMAASPSPSQAEITVINLLRAIRSPHSTVPTRPFSTARLPSFFSGSAPRDRRGRIARKSAHYTLNLKDPTAKREQSIEDLDDETPRNAGFGEERDREKEFLESLRSPELDVEEENGVEGPAGGWGLGKGQEHNGEEDDDDDEPLAWEQAQDVVERMVGLRG